MARALSLLLVVGLLVCSCFAGHGKQVTRSNNLPHGDPLELPLDKNLKSSSHWAAFSYYFYCHTCQLGHPDNTDIYNPNGCVPTNYTNTEFYQARCSANNEKIVLTYYSDADCKSDPKPHQHEYPTEKCILPARAWEATTYAHCRPKQEEYETLTEIYYQKVDKYCEQDPIMYTIHEIGCAETCSNSWVYGDFNTTAGTYTYLNGCPNHCDTSDYCGTGRSGKMDQCAQDEYTLLPRKVQVLSSN